MRDQPSTERTYEDIFRAQHNLQPRPAARARTLEDVFREQCEVARLIALSEMMNDQRTRGRFF
jgi:hypothetical protein